MRSKFFLAILFILTAGQASASGLVTPKFSAPAASENIVAFDHVFVSKFSSLTEVRALDAADRESYIALEIKPLMKFLFGPGTYRSIGSPQLNESIEVKWSDARLESGRVILPYHYIGVWILDLAVASTGSLNLPVPRNYSDLFTTGWKACTDSDPEHATASFYWYFWDPSRPGCDHSEGLQYDIVKMRVGVATLNESTSFPEYSRMIRKTPDGSDLSMTVAFGYVEDPAYPNPDRDSELGAVEYRAYLSTLRGWKTRFTEEPIYLKDYLRGSKSTEVIGHRFHGILNGVPSRINVVMAAGVDQMEIFAKSFAHDHDGVFGWFGHSRVGSGFDAEKFRALVRRDPFYYSVTEDYQLIYWGGCNSYSYYTLPFFALKAEGTRNLDIIAHGQPSLFVMNSDNAAILSAAFLNWPNRVSFQEILGQLEKVARRYGVTLLAAVLGDEDNPK